MTVSISFILSQLAQPLYAIQCYAPEEEVRLENAVELRPIFKFYFLCVYNFEISMKTRKQETDIISLISFSSCQLRR